MSTSIPRWRGFNIVDLFSTSVRWKEHFPMNDGLIAEEDFAMIQELGFNFVRIPMSYLFFGKGPWGREVDENRLWLIDRVVGFGQQYGLHVMLAFHRAPGYCITYKSEFDFPERGDLYRNDEDLRDFTHWWTVLAERYRDVPASALSFNLINEPVNIDDATFDRTFLPAIQAITAITPDRLIHAEGPFRRAGGAVGLVPPTTTIATLPNIVNSAHIYNPNNLTHYECPWHGANDLMPPTWPFTPTLKPGSTRTLTGDDARVWDKDALREVLGGYLDLAKQGYAVHVGELGAYSKVAHDVFLAYFSDLLDVLDEQQLGYSLWNFRGPFGILDTGRSDVDYVDFHGHALDKKLLDLLQRH